MMDKVVYEQDFLMLLSLSGLQQRRDICSLSKDLMRGELCYRQKIFCFLTDLIYLRVRS